MPRVYFHLLRLDGLLEDPEGAEFETIQLAHDEARSAARELVIDMLSANQPADVFALQLTSDIGECLGVIRLSSVLPKAFLPRLTLHLGRHFVQLRPVDAVLLDKPPCLIGEMPWRSAKC